MVVSVSGGWRWWQLVGVSAWCVSGPVPGGRGAEEDGVRVALLVAGGAGVGAVLHGSLGVPPRPVGVVCACCAVLGAVMGWEVVAWASGWACGP